MLNGNPLATLAPFFRCVNRQVCLVFAPSVVESEWAAEEQIDFGDCRCRCQTPCCHDGTRVGVGEVNPLAAGRRRPCKEYVLGLVGCLAIEAGINPRTLCSGGRGV